MGGFVLGWLFGKDLEKHAKATKKIVVNGIRVKIQKVNITNYLEGQKVLLATNEVHKTKGEKEAAAKNIPSDEKMRAHYRDILIAGVVSPKLCYKEEDEKAGEGMWVDRIMHDWDLVLGIHSAILSFTYGKKKYQHALSVAKGLPS